MILKYMYLRHFRYHFEILAICIIRKEKRSAPKLYPLNSYTAIAKIETVLRQKMLNCFHIISLQTIIVITYDEYFVLIV